MIDLEAFEKAVEAAREDIKEIRLDSDGCNDDRMANILEWTLVQIDDLTKKIAELEKKHAQDSQTS